jgi:hypothetical protein
VSSPYANAESAIPGGRIQQLNQRHTYGPSNTKEDGQGWIRDAMLDRPERPAFDSDRRRQALLCQLRVQPRVPDPPAYRLPITEHPVRLGLWIMTEAHPPNAGAEQQECLYVQTDIL